MWFSGRMCQKTYILKHFPTYSTFFWGLCVGILDFCTPNQTGSIELSTHEIWPISVNLSQRKWVPQNCGGPPSTLYIVAILALSQGSHNIWLRLYSSFLPPHGMVLHSLTTRCVPVQGAPPCIDVWSIILDPISCPPPHEALHGSHSQMLQTQSIGGGGGGGRVMQAEERSILWNTEPSHFHQIRRTQPQSMIIQPACVK